MTTRSLNPLSCAHSGAVLKACPNPTEGEDSSTWVRPTALPCGPPGRWGWTVSGIEVSRAAVRAAYDAGETRLAVASAEAIPFPDETFQVATLWDVLEHIPDPTAAISDVARVLAPGGRLILTTGDVESWLARISGPDGTSTRCPSTSTSSVEGVLKSFWNDMASKLTT